MDSCTIYGVSGTTALGAPSRCWAMTQRQSSYYLTSFKISSLPSSPANLLLIRRYVEGRTHRGKHKNEKDGRKHMTPVEVCIGTDKIGTERDHHLQVSG